MRKEYDFSKAKKNPYCAASHRKLNMGEGFEIGQPGGGEPVHHGPVDAGEAALQRFGLGGENGVGHGATHAPKRCAIRRL